MSFVAISKIQYPADLKEAIYAVGKNMIPIAKRQPGFISIAFHQTVNKNETMMYWEWASEQDHLNCMKSDDWRTIMDLSTSLFHSEGVELSIESYERLD